MSITLLPIARIASTSLCLLPATFTDSSFLWRLFHQCRDAEMRKEGVTVAEPLLRAQYLAREGMLQEQYPYAERVVVLLGDKTAAEPVGAMVISRSGGEAIRLINMGILPAYQGQGIGAALLQSLLNEAQKQGRSITLTVAAGDIAMQQFYLRFGFRLVAANTAKIHPTTGHREMVWNQATYPEVP